MFWIIPKIKALLLASSELYIVCDLINKELELHLFQRPFFFLLYKWLLN